jgi:hypothetical protein
MLAGVVETGWSLCEVRKCLLLRNMTGSNGSTAEVRRLHLPGDIPHVEALSQLR